MTSIEKAVKKRDGGKTDLKSELRSVGEHHQEWSGSTLGNPRFSEGEPDQERPVSEWDQGRASHANEEVARLNVAALQAAGMLTPDAGDSAIAEEFRHIKRPLLDNAFGRNAMLVDNGNVIMVTSALPEEGKTFVTMNLAVSFAMELDKTVLLVDADFMKESATRLFHAEKDVGLLNAIVDSGVRLEDVIQRTDVPKLSFLPAGRFRGKATELFASGKMRQITQELATRYEDRIILLDSPPLLATTEAVVLAGLMGQVVMVVEAGKTKQARVKEAIERIHPDKPVGMVLNKSRGASGSGYYYGYYGYSQRD